MKLNHRFCGQALVKTQKMLQLWQTLVFQMWFERATNAHFTWSVHRIIIGSRQDSEILQHETIEVYLIQFSTDLICSVNWNICQHYPHCSSSTPGKLNGCCWTMTKLTRIKPDMTLAILVTAGSRVLH